MTPRKYSYTFLAQAETLLIYGIFLFLTGLSQICVTITHRYIIERTIHRNENIHIRNLFPIKLTKDDIHLWFIYPSSALTIIPFLSCVFYTLFKRQSMAILICLSSIISFMSSSIYIGLLIVHTLDYWQTISTYRPRSYRPLTTTTTTTSSTQIFFPFDDQATFINLTLLITFTLALVQALLSLIGSVISFLWSPCCLYTSVAYKPIPTNSHYVQTSPHRYETPQSSTIRSIKRLPPPTSSETHRFIATNACHDPTTNSYIRKTSSLRGGGGSYYDEV